MIIDAHTHIGFISGRDWGPQDLIASMDEAGIEYSLLLSADITKTPIEKILDITKNQSRLIPIGHVTYSKVNNEQINKLINYLKDKKIFGIKLYPGYENFFPSDKKLHDLFKYCEENSYPIVIHTGVMLKGFGGYLEQVHPLAVDRLATEYPKLKIVMAHFGNPWLTDSIAVM